MIGGLHGWVVGLGLPLEPGGAGGGALALLGALGILGFMTGSDIEGGWVDSTFGSDFDYLFLAGDADVEDSSSVLEEYFSFVELK